MPTAENGWMNRGRIEWEWNVYPIDQGSTQVYVEVYAYFRMDQYASTNGTYPRSWSGWWGSGSDSWYANIGAGQRALLVSSGFYVTLTDSIQYLNFYVSTGSYHGTTTGSLEGVQVPARYAVAPSAVTVTRISDTEHRVDWTRGSTYSSAVVQRSEDGTNWSHVGTPAGNANTFTDTTTVGNKRYYWRVAGVGGSGQSPWSAMAGPVYTTPAPVGSIEATKVGSDIRLDVSGLPPYATAYDVYDNGTLVSPSGVNVTSFPWLHSAPNSGITHTYTIKSKRGALVSAFSAASNTVQLLAPPLAPTELSPNGVLAPQDTAVRFSWKHNPVDTTTQNGYQLRYRLIGAPTWTTVTGTTADFRDVSLALGDYEWQVCTRGDYATYGPWSPSAAFTVITRPGVAVQGGSSWDRPTRTATWTYSQAQSRPQSAWQAELLDSNNVRVDYREDTGAQTTVELPARLTDGATYTLRVRAATGEVWSNWSPVTFTVAFVPPAPSVVSGGWVEASGSVSLTVQDGGGAVYADKVTVERSLDSGVTWEPVIVGLDFSGIVQVTDRESRSGGVTLYRVTAIASSTGASSVTEYSVTADSGALWFSGGNGFSVAARLPYDPGVTITAGRSRYIKKYMGRRYPQANSGRMLNRTVEVAGRLRDGDPAVIGVDQLGELLQVAEPVFMYRDPDGRRIYGSPGDVAMPRQKFGMWEYSVTLTETSR